MNAPGENIVSSWHTFLLCCYNHMNCGDVASPSELFQLKFLHTASVSLSCYVLAISLLDNCDSVSGLTS